LNYLTAANASLAAAAAANAAGVAIVAAVAAARVTYQTLHCSHCCCQPRQQRSVSQLHFRLEPHHSAVAKPRPQLLLLLQLHGAMTGTNCALGGESHVLQGTAASLAHTASAGGATAAVL
jgi:hypothetical protein